MNITTVTTPSRDRHASVTPTGEASAAPSRQRHASVTSDGDAAANSGERHASVTRASRLLRAGVQDLLLVPALRAWCTSFQVSGADALDARRGPILLVANHASHLDAPAILAALPRHLRHRTAIAAAEDYFYHQPLVGLLASLGVGTFPFPRHGDLGLERAAALLDDGWNVLLFPEGTRSANGQIQRFRCGVGRLVAKARVPVVPVAVLGTHALWPKGHRLPRRGLVEIRFGAAWLPRADEDPREAADELGRQVAALKAAPASPAAAPVQPAAAPVQPAGAPVQPAAVQVQPAAAPAQAAAGPMEPAVAPVQPAADGLRRRLGWALARRVFLATGRLSDGIRLGRQFGFSSGEMLDYVYEDRARGWGPLGRMIDRAYLSSAGWRGIRERRTNLVRTLSAIVLARRAQCKPTRILDVAAGPGRYLLDLAVGLGGDDLAIECRDADADALALGRTLAAARGLTNVCYARHDALDAVALAAIRPAPDVVVASGLYEILLDDDAIRASLRGIGALLPPGGLLVLTGQPQHPQLALIANLLTHRDGTPWRMRPRSTSTLERWCNEAGLVDLQTHGDTRGIFTITVGRKPT